MFRKSNISAMGCHHFGLHSLNTPLQTMDRLKKALDDNNIMYTEKLFETIKGVESLGDNPFVCSETIIMHTLAMYIYRHRVCY